MYCIKKGNLYVSKSGSKNSYTNIIQSARQFNTIESARCELCPENERIVSIYQELN
jgi:hypothetical protein